jgi:hypothetical protein
MIYLLSSRRQISYDGPPIREWSPLRETPLVSNSLLSIILHIAQVRRKDLLSESTEICKKSPFHPYTKKKNIYSTSQDAASSGLFSVPNKSCWSSTTTSPLFLSTVESSNLDWQAAVNSSTRDDCKEVKKLMADKDV